eukprot:CAMPEP_0172698560 /NCGR_PEP_ID=MMETSP1074-20121228/29566_1 /TAXON_ID=2916 /ORGANISM="Ceratium fusus, Strain PA161109" /LENGTH=45 /DNA_ID= /DNA_START= /DNA_END= /DNA_ORIENTATION=
MRSLPPLTQRMSPGAMTRSSPILLATLPTSQKLSQLRDRRLPASA